MEDDQVSWAQRVNNVQLRVDIIVEGVGQITYTASLKSKTEELGF